MTKAGRPSAYDPRFIVEAEKLCALGATDFELAGFFKITVTTLNRWKAQHPEFCASIKTGKEPADDRVERSLFNRAVGYTYESEKIAINAQGEVTRAKTVEHVPPDTAAAFIWLKNRRKTEWRDRHEYEIGGVGDFERMSNDELRSLIQASLAQTGDGGDGAAQSGIKGLIRPPGRIN